ncbi:MAG: sel1 repeat family protein [Lewinellaceae bacterium]|nr:sel1 repeat family protein [Lewinellaceae bacterium]
MMSSNLDLIYEALELWYSGESDAAIKNLSGILHVNLQSNLIKAGKEPKDLERSISNLCESSGQLFYHLSSPDIEKAEQCWLWVAAENSDAAYNIGLIYLSDKRDIDKAINWLKKSSEMENAKAMFELGKAYLEKQEFKQAVEWIEKSAETGYATAINMLIYFLFLSNQQNKKPRIGF